MRSIGGRGIVALGAAMVWAVTASDARADCKNDAECKGDRICEKGVCVSPQPAAPPPAAAPAGALPPSAPPAVPPPAGALPPPTGAAPAQGAPPGDAVRVSIEGRKGDHVVLEGRTSAECRAPCTVAVSPGRYTLRGKGFEREIDVPPNQASHVEMRRACTACFILGGILTPAGIPFIAGGAALLDEATKTRSSYTGSYYNYYKVTDEGLQAGAITMIVNGVIFSTTGIIFLILGGTHGGTAAIVNGDSASSGTTVFASTPSGVSVGTSSQGVFVSF